MGNTNTNGHEPSIDDALGGVPAKLKEKLLLTYRQLKESFLCGHFELSGLKGGKFCEVALRIVQNELTGSFIPLGSKIPNYKIECERLEKLPSSAGPESLRILIPRALMFLYTFRNKRDIGHVGGDIDANEIDAACFVRIADWCLCELIRVFYTLPIEEAQSLVDSIAERRLPLVWEVVGKKRILNTDLNYKDQVLLLLYTHSGGSLPLEDLLEWTESSRKDNFVRSVILPLHVERLVEYDRTTSFVFISPTGSRKVEDELLPSLAV